TILFFQAEDGIRDATVTGVQTCALPICHPAKGRVRAKTGTLDKVTSLAGVVGVDAGHPLAFAIVVNDIPAGQRTPSRAMADDMRSEERRVGREWGCRWAGEDGKGSRPRR